MTTAPAEATEIAGQERHCYCWYYYCLARHRREHSGAVAAADTVAETVETAVEAVEIALPGPVVCTWQHSREFPATVAAAPERRYAQ